MLHSHLSAQRAQCQRQSGARIVLTAVLASGIGWSRSQLRPQGTKSGPLWSLKYWVGLVGALALSFVQLSAAAPDAPTNVMAVRGNVEAVVSFTAPASNGGAIITGYTVTSSPGVALIEIYELP